VLRLPSPLREFCCHVDPVTKVRTFDFNEWHAVECGVGDALSFAPFWRSWRLHKKEWHYYIVARGGTTAVVVTVAAIFIRRCAHGLHRG
jgi:hypothetical protein